MAPKKNTNRAHWLNPSNEASVVLDAVMQTDAYDHVLDENLEIVDDRLKKKIEKKKEDEIQNKEIEKKKKDEHVSNLTQDGIAVEEARKEEPILTQITNRNKARILFFTKDISIKHEGSIAFQRITDLRHMFAEVHIILINFKEVNDPEPTLRFFDNVWLYTTQTTSWWKSSFDAYKIAEQQLSFGGAFRADVLIAEDPFESGLTACLLAKKYNRPVQLHTYEDFFSDEYTRKLEHPTIYTWIMHYVLDRVVSVCTKTEFQRRHIIAINPNLEKHIEIFPRYYNLVAWRDFVPTCNLHERYSQFKFIILHISAMQTNSHSQEVLLGVSPILRRYATACLVIVGNGPLRSKLEKQAIALGLHNQIKFEPMPDEILSHIKSSNVFIHLSEDTMEDEIILSAAVSKVPIIAHTQGLAGKLFTQGESAYLCDATDISCVTESINRYLNDNHSRIEFTIKAHDTVFERIKQDYTQYIEAYATTIERSLM
jgi:glycosyltransferase involved in cell wall biosynthesis